MSVIYCRMDTMGQCVYQLEFSWEGELPETENIEIKGAFREEKRSVYLKKKWGTAPGDVRKVSVEDGNITILTEPFCCRGDFSVTVRGKDLIKTLEKKAFDEIRTEGFDLFEAKEEGNVLYRLYSPKSTEKRPMILFLHGGGNGGPENGRDNRKQLLADYGPINFALDYPDVYVMAPQAVEKINPFFMVSMMKKMTFATSAGDPENGWSRRYLGEICDIIRRMVKEGKVDPDRIYVTGLSMGGGGTIRAMSVGADLFAACAPVCPTMTPETFDILRTMKAPVWVSTAYVDHTVYRHKYITDAILQLKDDGHKNAHLTLYAPEELEKYDIGAGEDLTHEERFGANHTSWVLTYHNEHGIMSWLLNQKKGQG